MTIGRGEKYTYYYTYTCILREAFITFICISFYRRHLNYKHTRVKYTTF